jgi:hypothetical protein
VPYTNPLPLSIAGGAAGHHLGTAGHHPRLHEAFNTGPLFVVDQDFGAVGDGSTDDTGAINAALAAVPATGGVVYLPWGRYKITAPLLIQQEATMLVGAGTGQRVGATQDAVGARIEVGAGFTGSQAIRVQRVADDRPLYGVTLRDFTLDGGTVGSGVDGILYRSNRGLVDHVHVHRMSGAGFHLLGYATWDLYDTVLRTIQAGDNAAAGVYYDSFSADGHMIGSVVYNNQDSVLIKAGSLQITGCHLYDATRYNVFFDGGGSRTKIEACKIEGAGQHGINIDSTNGGFSDIQILGCGISSNGDSSNNTYDNVIVQGPSGNGVGRTVIVGNAIGVKSGVTNEARYGVNLASTAAQNTLITGNVFTAASSFGTAAVNNAGSTSLPAIIRQNINWVTESSGTVAFGAAITSVTGVAHGLSVTPAAKDFSLQFAADPLAAGHAWVSAITSTDFTLNLKAAPGGAGTTVAWQAQVL